MSSCSRDHTGGRPWRDTGPAVAPRAGNPALQGGVQPLAVPAGREMLAGEIEAGAEPLGRCTLEDDPTTVVAGARGRVDEPVGRAMIGG